MAKNPSAIASKGDKTTNARAKAIAVVASNNKEKEKKEKYNESNVNGKMTGRGGRGAAVAAGRGRGDGAEEATRKRKSKDSFDEKHDKNLANVYAVWNKKTDIIKPTKYWNGLLKADKEAVKPYTMDDLMGEGDDTIHNRCRIADKKKVIKTGEFHSVEFWLVLFSNAFNTKAGSYNDPSSPKLRSFALRLCKTDPSTIFDEYAWNAETIKSRQDTIAWVAARKFLGDVWSSKAFDISKEVEDMEVDEDMNIELDTAKMVTPAKSSVTSKKKKKKVTKHLENRKTRGPRQPLTSSSFRKQFGRLTMTATLATPRIPENTNFI